MLSRYYITVSVSVCCLLSLYLSVIYFRRISVATSIKNRILHLLLSLFFSTLLWIDTVYYCLLRNWVMNYLFSVVTNDTINFVVSANNVLSSISVTLLLLYYVLLYWRLLLEIDYRTLYRISFALICEWILNNIINSVNRSNRDGDRNQKLNWNGEGTE